MKPHPRLRRTIKRTVLGLTGLSLIVYVGSVWCWVSWHLSPHYAVGVRGGLLLLSASTRAIENGMWPDFNWEYSGMSPEVVPRIESVGQPGDLFGAFTLTVVPLLPIVGLLVVVSAGILRADVIARRRAKSSACLNCGYSRADLPPSTPCPECGKHPDTPRARAEYENAR